METAKEIRWWEAEEGPGQIDVTKRIEDRTKQDIFNLLKRYGLGKVRRRKWLDYQQAKKVCFEGLLIDSGIYDKQIGWISDYLKL